MERYRKYDAHGNKLPSGHFEVICDGCQAKPETLRMVERDGNVITLCALCLIEHLTRHKTPAATENGNPLHVVYKGSSVRVKTWREAFATLLGALLKDDQPGFGKILKGFPRQVGLDSTRFHEPKSLSNSAYFYEGHLPSKKVKSLFAQVAQTLKMENGALKLEAR